jgi:RHS repeat-associated protein
MNWASINDNGYVVSFTPDAMNQYTSVNGTGLGYDANFNLTWNGGTRSNFDAEKRLVSASGPGGSVQFVYDGLGRCVKRTINGAPVVYAYDGWKPIFEHALDGSWFAVNMYGPGADEILWRYQSNVGHLRYHSDIHGNVTTLLDWSGNVVEKYTYDAFGSPAITDWWGNPHYDAAGHYASWYGNRFLFQGREYFPELGLYDYRHRFYDPSLGRFLQTDPTGFDAGDMNLYRYCDDDPIDQSDPTGLYSVDSRYSSLTSMGGGDWIKGSEGLSAWDYAQGMGTNRPQAGMDGGGGGDSGGGKSKAISAENEGNKAYTYSLKQQFNIGDLSGARGYQYVSDPDKRVSGECLAGVQHLTGTPSSHTPLLRGAAVGPNTHRGAAIATGWELNKHGQWVYPSKPASSSSNHAAVYVAPAGKGLMQILSQAHGRALQLEIRRTDGWNVITSTAPPTGHSSSQLRPVPRPFDPSY